MEKLKILFVLQTPWGTNLGMSKVHHDLKHEYEKLGHQVDYIDWDRLYPKGQNVVNKIWGPLYTERIFQYLKQHAHKYDVIDANFNCIPYPKASYNFKGVVVYRSHGLQPLYRQIELSAAYKKMEYTDTYKVSLKNKLGNMYRFLQRKDGDYELFNSIRYADIVHALNQAEYSYFIEYGIPKEKVFLIPNGLPDEQLGKTSDIPEGGKKNVISFLGSWTLRKGIIDLNSIFTEILTHTTLDQINLLGGGKMFQTNSFFEARFHPLIQNVPHFTQTELPAMLNTTKVGVFPSYAEGFGLAILEQLALGIPVVAYDTPGPTDILSPLDETLLIKPGDKAAFGLKVAELLDLTEEKYAELSLKCKERAGFYRISSVSKDFIAAYQSSLAKINYSS